MINYDIELSCYDQDEIQRILDRDLNILDPKERTIELWMRIFGNDLDYELSKTKLMQSEIHSSLSCSF